MGTNSSEKREYIRDKIRNSRKIQTLILKITGWLLMICIITNSILSADYFSEFSGLKKFIEHSQGILYIASIALILMMLAYERSLDFSNIDLTLEDQNTVLNNLDQKISTQEKLFSAQEKQNEIILTKLADLKILCDRINVQTDLIDEMESLKSYHFDSYLNDIFSDLIDRNIHFLKEGIQNKRVVFTESNSFELAYTKTLERIGSCEFYATAAANSNYFWTKKGEPNTAVENSVKHFINSGGKMTRIFFTDDDTYKNQDVLDILKKQVELGVNVYLLQKKFVSGYINEYFGVDENKSICWNVQTDDTQEIKNYIYSINQKDAEKFKKQFEKLMSNSHIVKFEG